MKKIILTTLITLVAVCTSAETFSYLKFTKTDGVTLTYSVDDLTLTYDDDNIHIINSEGAATIPLSEVLDMYFSNQSESSFLRGDVNGDREIGIADVMCLIDYLLTRDTSGVIIDAVDCNNDGEVSVADVMCLIDYLLGGSW